ncbi:hypothetical protein D3C81_1710970 [compost metagenome]
MYRREHPSPTLPLAFAKGRGRKRLACGELPLACVSEAVVWRMAQMCPLPFAPRRGGLGRGVFSLRLDPYPHIGHRQGDVDPSTPCLPGLRR